jgi:hypothetical protein
MGLLKASLIFVIGNFSISLMQQKHIETIPFDKLPMFGEELKKYSNHLVLNNKPMALLIIISLIEFIL